MEQVLKQILDELKVMKTDMSELKSMKTDMTELKSDMNDLKEGQHRLEVGQARLQKNLIESLGSYTDKIIEHVENKTEVLNKRVYRVESEIERLSR
ncbi:hypothetical protein [Bacillus sp. Marseille-Q3570]|uniref:hypothetical protein n=1 Tax=Bacillus sp. Marseille-Q3570 TaxID=2963522 RepID=UPI0021B6F0EB|nr:hypothetical protein [Bacillus sp. Marseille-Q3570]